MWKKVAEETLVQERKEKEAMPSTQALRLKDSQGNTDDGTQAAHHLERPTGSCYR